MFYHIKLTGEKLKGVLIKDTHPGKLYLTNITLYVLGDQKKG